MFMKRLIDIIISSMALVVFTPFFTVIALFIIIDSPGGVFFRQVRVGLNRKHFRMYKFRTMISDASLNGLKITAGNDSRITKVGMLLRKYKIDELPQLVNVFLGDMSFVGPRPEVPEYARVIPDQEFIYSVKPGMTDPASIAFRDESEMLDSSSNPHLKYVTEILPQKVRLNMEYIKGANIWTDALIMFRTIKCIFWG
ncbi:MAG: sugar transferase [Deltaproteobacteria bacterium]|nr:sugar transferase [Deltaproteobacteria bacterium]